MSAAVRITDHALLRYLERIVGFDFSGHRDTLARRLQPALEAGAGVAKLDDVNSRDFELPARFRLLADPFTLRLAIRPYLGGDGRYLKPV